MNEQDIREMQRLIDEGIRLAQMRLVERAKHDGFSLVVYRNGMPLSISPSEL